MGLYKTIRMRFAGGYRREERLANDFRLAAIGRIFGGVRDERLRAFLADLSTALRRQNAAIRSGQFLGGAAARLLVADTPVHDAIDRHFGNDRGQLAFRDITLPKPIDSRDKRRFDARFFDTLFAYLLENEAVAVDRSLLADAPYDLDARFAPREGETVLDCGAGMGVFAALAAARRCLVHAFEPDGRILDAYLRKTAEWNPKIAVCPRAVSDGRRTLDMGMGRRSGVDKWLLRRQQPKTSAAIALDDYTIEKGVRRIDFIKADVAGSECAMLEGARRLLREYSPKLAIRVRHPKDGEAVKRLVLDIQPGYALVEKPGKIYAYRP